MYWHNAASKLLLKKNHTWSLFRGAEYRNGKGIVFWYLGWRQRKNGIIWQENWNMRWKTRKIPERIYWRGGSCGNCNGREALLSYLSPQFLILYFPPLPITDWLNYSLPGSEWCHRQRWDILLSKLKTEIAKNGIRHGNGGYGQGSVSCKSMIVKFSGHEGKIIQWRPIHFSQLFDSKSQKNKII